MKKNRIKNFLDELAKCSNISVACEKSGLSRQTIYRWMDSDCKIREKVDQAMYLGVESINDLSESKIITHIKNGNLKAAQYWLDNHKRNYIKPRTKEVLEVLNGDKEVDKIEIEIFERKFTDKDIGLISDGREKSSDPKESEGF